MQSMYSDHNGIMLEPITEKPLENLQMWNYVTYL